MPTDPFAAMSRAKRLRARCRRWATLCLRPGRPSRLDPARGGPPNLLVVAVDTLRHDHLGHAGYARPTSPVLDHLVARSTLFADVMAPAPWTLPSFTSSLTGVMPSLHGAILGGDLRNMDRQPPRRLHRATLTLARHLGDLGYRTAAFTANPFFAFGLAETFQQHGYYNLPAWEVAFLGLEWIRRHAERPFFCFLLLNDPHEPTTPPPGHCESFLAELNQDGKRPAGRQLRALARWGDEAEGTVELGREIPPLSGLAADSLAIKLALYDGAVAYVDATIGRILRQLERWGLDRSTLVTVYADHGEEFLDHARQAKRWDHDPRRVRAIGHGQSHFQELLHVPWLATGPGVPSGARVVAPVSLCDVAPTLVDWLGIDPFPLPAAEVAGLVGRTLAPLAAEVAAQAAVRAPARPAMGQDSGSEASATRDRSEPPGTPRADDDRWLLAEDIAYGPDLVAVRQAAWKMIATRSGEPLALFHLGEDPRELQDRCAEQPAIVARFGTKLAAWRRAASKVQGPASGPEDWTQVSATVRRRLKELGYSD